jgi:uncharacterized membrane protein (UPF0127 family)
MPHSGNSPFKYIWATTVALFFFYTLSFASIYFQQVRIGYHTFQCEVADTPASRETGLMFRSNIAPQRGMLFMFGKPDIHMFWMKNTLVPLDIIWIDNTHKIVFIKHQAAPFDETLINPGVPAQYVLEIRGGLAKKYMINVKDEVKFIPELNKKSL